MCLVDQSTELEILSGPGCRGPRVAVACGRVTDLKDLHVIARWPV